MSGVVGQPLQTERLPTGERKLSRELVYNDDGESINVPAGFTTDYSSYPMVLLYFLVPVLLWLFGLSPLWGLLLLLIPDWSRVDIAGILHDYGWRSDMGFMKSNNLWFKTAIRGDPRRLFVSVHPASSPANLLFHTLHWFFGLLHSRKCFMSLVFHVKMPVAGS